MTTNVYMLMSEPMFQKLSSAPSPSSANNPSAVYGTNSVFALGAIEVLDYDFKIKQKGSEEGGRPRSVEYVTREEFRLKKAVDSRSPKLFRYCCDGTYIGIVEIVHYGPSGSPTSPAPPFLTYRMSYVHISSYEPTGGEGIPKETIGLTYGQMEVIFNNAGMGGANKGNSRSGSVQQAWSWVMDIPNTITAGPYSTSK